MDSFMITPQMVLKKVMGLHPEKSPEPDGSHPVFLINVADLINVPLARLFQKSLIDDVVPPQWLVASVIAIHKKGAKNFPENYRPVSIVRLNVVAHISKNNLISEKQDGFVAKRNCMTNLLICLDMDNISG